MTKRLTVLHEAAVMLSILTTAMQDHLERGRVDCGQCAEDVKRAKKLLEKIFHRTEEK